MAEGLSRVTPDAGGSTNPELLIPKRNPGLIERIAGLIFRSQPQLGPQQDQQQSTKSGITVQALQSVFDQYFKSQSDRLAVYKDVDEMDEVSEEISVALDTIADNATTSEDGQQMSFQVASDDPKVQAVIDDVVDAARLHGKVYSIVRNLIKYGDNFGEIVVNAEGQVVELRQLPPSTMFRNQDSRGDLLLGRPEYDPSGNCTTKGGTCAFEQRAEDTQTVVAGFWPWQIVHIRNNHDGFRPYGRSHLRVARIVWKKLKAVEEAMIMARLIRAYPKLRVKVDTTGLSPAEAKAAVTEVHQALNQRQALDGRREQPYQMTSDVYLGVPKVKDSSGKFSENASTVELLEPTAQAVYNIDDVKGYFHRKLLVCLRIPPAHLGWEEMVNAKATVSQQDVQYVRFLRRIQQMVGHALEQVFDTALVLQGMDPAQAAYEITWPMLSASDESAAADAELSRAQADNVYAQLHAIDAEWIMQHRFDMTDEEMEELRARMDEANRAAAEASAADDAEPAEESDQEPEQPEEPQDDAREQQVHSEEDLHELDPALLLAWSDKARAAALAARARKGRMRATTGAAHTHVHAHGDVQHAHPHSHVAGPGHAHSHAAMPPGAVHVISQEEVEAERHAEGVRRAALLAGQIAERTQELLKNDLDLVAKEQQRALNRARQVNDEVA